MVMLWCIDKLLCIVVSSLSFSSVYGAFVGGLSLGLFFNGRF